MIFLVYKGISAISSLLLSTILSISHFLICVIVALHLIIPNRVGYPRLELITHCLKLRLDTCNLSRVLNCSQGARNCFMSSRAFGMLQ